MKYAEIARVEKINIEILVGQSTIANEKSSNSSLKSFKPPILFYLTSHNFSAYHWVSVVTGLIYMI